MLKISENSTSTTASSASNSSSNSKNTLSDNDNKLSLLVKAAEKVKRDEAVNGGNEASSNKKSFQNEMSLVTGAEQSNNTSINSSNFSPMFIGKNGKPTRPFKAYPKESLSMPIGSGCSTMNLTPVNNINAKENTQQHQSSSPTPTPTPTSPSLAGSSSPTSTLNANNNQNILFSTLTAITNALNSTINSSSSPSSLSNENKIDAATGVTTPAITTENLLELLALALIQPQQQQQQLQQQQQQIKSLSQQQQLLPSIKSETANSPPKTNVNLNENVNETRCSASPQNNLTSNNQVNKDILANSTNNSIQTSNLVSSNGINSTSLNEILLTSGISDDDIAASLDNISALAHSTNDFCTQYRKRINQAQERLLQKHQQKVLSNGNAISSNFSSSTLALLQHQQHSNKIASTATTSTILDNNDDYSLSNSSISSLTSSSSSSNKNLITRRRSSTKKKATPVDSPSNLQIITEQTAISKLGESVIVNNISSLSPTDLANGSLLNSSTGSCGGGGEYMNYPPKKRHRIQQEMEQSKISNGNESSLPSPPLNELASSELAKSQRCSRTPTIELANNQNSKLVNTTSFVAINNDSLSPALSNPSSNTSLASSSDSCLTRANQTSKLGQNSAAKIQNLILTTPPSTPSSTAMSYAGVNGNQSSSSPNAVKMTSRPSSSDDADKDDAYRERRRKNNEAAKRSRDARRAKEDDIALRAAILERENLQLKVELAQLKQETTRLRCMLYSS